MSKQIFCRAKNCQETENVRVRIIRAPIVNTIELKRVIFARARALVL